MKDNSTGLFSSTTVITGIDNLTARYKDVFTQRRRALGRR
ncbi:unnamed protein product, partial [Brugia timori]|uniref:Transposase n=1 Tax=Brugia timori TaxID=42155 RepID=A0A0R3Q6F4_9BILA